MSYTYEYPRPAVAVDILAFDGRRSNRSILLIKRGNDPYKDCWALPGGHIEPGEDLVDAAIREFWEEVGIQLDTKDLKQLGAYGTPGRDPRGDYVSIAFVAPLGCKVKPCAGDDAAEAKWFALSELPALAFDHGKIIQEALQGGRV